MKTWKPERERERGERKGGSLHIWEKEGGSVNFGKDGEREVETREYLY